MQCAGGGRAVQQFTAQFPEIVSLLEDTEGNRSKNDLYLIGSSRVACCGGLCKAAFVLVQVTVWRLWLTVFADRKSKNR